MDAVKAGDTIAAISGPVFDKDTAKVEARTRAMVSGYGMGPVTATAVPCEEDLAPKEPKVAVGAAPVAVGEMETETNFATGLAETPPIRIPTKSLVGDEGDLKRIRMVLMGDVTAVSLGK